MTQIDRFRPAASKQSRSAWASAGLVGLAALAVLALGGADADARGRSRIKHPVHGASYHPPYADIVIDDHSGQVLHEADPDAPRHPASLTKVMTLYLLFGELEAGRIKLDANLPISLHASVQNPTKLGLRAGQTIKVEDAIKGIVTKSANDAAVVVAEALGGSEEAFAQMMTRKARALGMMSTVYINASGLPAEEQITTARDQALLGRAVQHRFPAYYSYFSLPNFAYRGRQMSNHNSLLRTVEGVDGIKTGYTEASGYNLICSTRRGERRIVSVILGERSNGARDTRMRGLVEQFIVRAANERTAAKIVEHDEPATDVAILPTPGFSLQSSTPAADAPAASVAIAPAAAVRAAAPPPVPAGFQAVP
jgi:D-alanyl-D-alanine carboxypeptidase